MSSRDYWEKRALESRLRAEQQTLRSLRQIEEATDRATAAIQKDIAYWLSKFADNNQISLAEAKKLLKADELKEFRWTVEEYIRQGENNLDGRWERQLVNTSSRVHISRLEALQTQLRQQVEALSGKKQAKIESLLGDLYQNQYYHTAFKIQKGLGIGWDLQKLDDRKVKAVLSRPWAADGKVFSDRIWEDKTRLLSELDTEITRTILTGQKWDKAVRNIADRMRVSKNQAGRLVMTEAAAIDSVAQGQCYQDLDVEEFENVATLDFKTSEICREMDGKHFLMSEYKIGVTAPPFHPWCRTCTAPYFADWEQLGGAPMRAARDQNGQGYELVPADLTYKEWEKRFVKEKPVENTAANGIIKITTCMIADDKIYKFMLKDGAKHSQEFFEAGYSTKDGERLRNDITGQFNISKAEDYRENEDGSVKFSIFMQLGVGEKRRFRTVWLQENEQAEPRLITAHREDEK